MCISTEVFLCCSGILGHNSTSCFAKLFSLTSFPFLVFFVAKRTRRSLFLLAFFLRNLSKMFHNLVLVIDASPKKNLGKMRKFRPLHFSLSYYLKSFVLVSYNLLLYLVWKEIIPRFDFRKR